jgi:hypothetical protein
MPQGKNQPWGHGESTEWKPKDPTQTGCDNPTAIAPAGCMHMRIEDWGRFVAVTLSSPLASEVLGLTSETHSMLYQPVASDYSTGGWIATQRGWAKGGDVLTHMGSNTMNTCVGWLALNGLSKDGDDGSSVGFLVCTNSGNNDLVDQIVGPMIHMPTHNATYATYAEPQGLDCTHNESK